MTATSQVLRTCTYTTGWKGTLSEIWAWKTGRTPCGLTPSKISVIVVAGSVSAWSDIAEVDRTETLLLLLRIVLIRERPRDACSGLRVHGNPEAMIGFEWCNVDERGKIVGYVVG